MKDKIYKLNSKKSWVSSLSVLLGALVPMRAMAGIVDGFITFLGGVVWDFFVTPIVWFLQLELFLLRTVASYNNFTREPGVVIGWTAVRDLSNMFFILILLVIAFATILNIKSYGYQQLLSRTIIIAILINFSKTIVGFAIDISQVIMLTFVRAVNDVITGGIAVALGIQGIGQAPVGGFTDLGGDYAVAIVGGLIMLLIAVVVIAVLVMMLVMRLVALWVAIVLAPLAFVANIFPNTRSFYNKWVKELGSNLATGPMLAFFLWLTFAITASGTAYQSFNLEGGIAEPTQFLGKSNMVNFIVAITLLLMGMKMAAQSGAAGANFAAKGLKTVQDRASKVARRYPLAAASRLGSLASRGLIRDEDGKARSLGTGLKNTASFLRLNKLNNTRAGRFVGQRSTIAGDYIQSLRQGVRDYSTREMESGSKVRKFGGKLASIPSSVVDKMEGVVKGGVKWNRVPFYGGQLQRAAMKMQGLDEARIAQFKAEDEKNIPQRFKRQFEESQATMTGSKFQKAWSYASSLGGNRDRDVMIAQNLVDRGEITLENAKWAADQLRRGGDEERLQKIQGEYHNTFKNLDEALRLIRSKGLKGILGSFQGDAYYERDEDGNVKRDEDGNKIVSEGAKIALKAIHDPSHGQADANAISKLLLGNNKLDRWAFDSVKHDHFQELFGMSIKDMETADFNEQGAIEIGKRGEVSPNLNSPAMLAFLSLAKDYANKTVDRVDSEGHVKELGPDALITAGYWRDFMNRAFAPGEVAAKMQRFEDELEPHFKERKQEARELDTSVWTSDQSRLAPHLRGRFGSAEDFEEYRSDRYKQLLGIKTTFEDKYGNKLDHVKHVDDADIFDSDMKDEEKLRAYYIRHLAPPSLRKDIAKQEDLVKESEEGVKARQQLAAKKPLAADFLRQVEEHVKAALPVYQSNWAALTASSNFDAATTEYIRRKAIAEMDGNKRMMHDLASVSAWTEVLDGAHGSRGAEVNIGNRREAAKLKHWIKPMENQQQAQMFAVTVPDQTEFLLRTLVELGKKPQKAIVENSGQLLRSEAMQSYQDSVNLSNNVMSQDYSRLHGDMKKTLFLVSEQAKKAGMGMTQYLRSENPAANFWVEQNLAIYNKNHPDKKISIDDLDNNQVVKSMIQEMKAMGISVQFTEEKGKDDDSGSTTSKKKPTKKLFKEGTAVDEGEEVEE